MPKASIVFLPEKATLTCQGSWTVSGIETIQHDLSTYAACFPIEHLNVEHIKAMDVAGACLLGHLLAEIRSVNEVNPQLEGFAPDHQRLFDLISKEETLIPTQLTKPGHTHLLYTLGKTSVSKWDNCHDFIAFMGELVVMGWRAARSPSRFHWRSVFVAIEETGIAALPIIALMSFLIGVVLAYQMGLQLETYDANIYIVELSGMAIFREFGPLIAAIIAAGRTSTAFTSEIGTMKVNEEIDALSTMGIHPVARLVLPKLLGFVIAMPLLTVWADGFGILGSMAMSKHMLGINFTDFLVRFQQVIAVKHYFVGLVKAPFFAAIIAMVGCFQGFQVEQDAASVGKMTTRSAVQSLFLIIIIDAFFSVLFSMEGI